MGVRLPHGRREFRRLCARSEGPGPCLDRAVIRAAAIDPPGWHLYVTTVLMKQLFDDLGLNETRKDVRNAAR
jgi:hypothetical protein